MIFWNDLSKVVHQVRLRRLHLALTGNILVVMMLGALFSLTLVRFAFFIVAFSMIVLLYYCMQNFSNWHERTKISFRQHCFGLLGLFSLVFFFGIQSPQILFQKVLLLVGIILNLPLLADVLQSKFKLFKRGIKKALNNRN